MLLKDAVNVPLLLSFVAIFTVKGQSLRDTTLQADYVIICASTNGAQAERLAQFRRSHNGFTVKVVCVESVYVDFNLSRSADTSLRSFMTYSTKSWGAPSPRFFVLAGNVNTIPSHKEPGLQVPPTILEDSILVDNWFVETQGASPGILRSSAAIGRLPSWTSGQLDTIISKTIAYEQQAPDAWMGRSLTLADYNTTDGNVFENCASYLQRALSYTWSDTTMVHIRGDSPQYRDWNGFLSEWQRGAAVISFVGHGNPWVFSRSRYFVASDLAGLGNGTRLPICFFLACQQSYNHTDSASIVEQLLTQHAGGAIATIASSGLAYLDLGYSFFNQLAEVLSKNPNLSLGEAVSETRNSTGSYSSGSITRRLTLLGDPAITPKRLFIASAITSAPSLPKDLSLAQNYPNPFNPSTRMNYSLPVADIASLKVFDMLGREVATLVDGFPSAGVHTVEFNGSKLCSGVYLARLQMHGISVTKKLILAK